MPNRSTIAKIGHITRELNLKKPLSKQSLSRLTKILELQKEGFSSPENIDQVIEQFKQGKTIDDIDNEMQFWIYEFLEHANAGLIDIEFGEDE